LFRTSEIEAIIWRI